MLRVGFPALATAVALLSLTIARAEPTSPAALSDAELLAYASRPYDKGALMRKQVVLGRNGSATVVADHPCSDVCPNYTVRVIHYELLGDQNCSAVGGVEKELLVPRGIAETPERFCFPRILADHWDQYVR
jgi:hypothetical protein